MAAVVVVTVNVNETDGTGGVRLTPTLVGDDGALESERGHGLNDVSARPFEREPDTHTRLEVHHVNGVVREGGVAALDVVHVSSIRGREAESQ